MQPFPELPPLSAVDLEGHLWIQELLAGEPLRFGLDDAGRIAFADRRGPIEEPPPPSLRASVRFVRERLDREALRGAVEDPTSVVLYGVATRFEGVPYDFGRLPPLLVTDVYAPARDAYLPPDAVERVADRLGLPVVDAVEKEVEAEYFDPDGYDLPDSAWYDGPVAGVVFRNKRGDRAVRRNPDAREDVEPLPAEPAVAAAAVVTSRRVRQVVSALEDRGVTPDVEAVFDGVLERVGREEYARIPEDFDGRAFRSAVAERVQEQLG